MQRQAGVGGLQLRWSLIPALLLRLVGERVRQADPAGAGSLGERTFEIQTADVGSPRAAYIERMSRMDRGA